MRDEPAPPGAIALQDLQVQVRGRRLLGPLDARFLPGRITALLGPNGAGKSTLLSVLTGWRQPDAGTVHWQGRPLQQISAAAPARQCALVAQDTQVAADFRVHELWWRWACWRRGRPTPRPACARPSPSAV